MHKAATTVPLVNIRLASKDDAHCVFELLTDNMSKIFRINSVEDVEALIYKSVLAICQINADNHVVGFMATKDYPPIPSLHPGSWEEFIWSKYKMMDINARNTQFIHLLCWNPQYAREVVDNMLVSIFMHDPYVHYIALFKSLTKTTQLMPGQLRAEGSFRRVQAMERGMSGEQLPGLCLAERKEVSPRLRIRRAVEEDNDDIIPTLERHSKRLRSLYGDYYVTEIISRHPELDRVLLVCEHSDLAVGVMGLNSEINYETLEESFDLAAFSGLRHLDRPVHLERPAEGSSLISESFVVPLDSSYCLETVQGALDKGPKGRMTSVIQQRTYEENEFKNVQQRPSTMVPQHLPGQDDQVVLDLLDQDEEEVEFDIINIDPDLMKLPQFLSPTDNFYKNIIDSRQHEMSVDQSGAKKRASKTAPSVSTTKDATVTRYSGTPNAFLIELFAVHPDYDERYGFDILEVAFEMFPDRDYCVLCLPSNHSCFPLLEHFTLVTPYSTSMRFINDSLYVAHVNSVRGTIRVRPGELNDMDVLGDILEHAPRKDAITELFQSSLSSTALDSYVMLSQNQPLGVCIVGPLEDGIATRTQYCLDAEPQTPGGDGTILGAVLSPVMDPHSRFFLREVIRQSRFNTLFWMCQPNATKDASPRRNMMSLAERMMPVSPRKLMPNISGNKTLDIIQKNISTPFSLWMIEKPLTSLPKVYVNNNIVVVGASRTGLSFIEYLIMGPTSSYLTFTNLTLVSETGLPAGTEMLKAAETAIPRRGRYTERYVKTIPFSIYVDVMVATMHLIDRKKKCIHLKGGGVKYYDELILTCGKQFQHPHYMIEALEIVRELKKGKPCERMLMDDPNYQPDQKPTSPDVPENVMLISSTSNANMCLRRLLHMISVDKLGLNYSNPVVVYGDCVEAYCCMSALIEIGVNPKHILFVEPFPPDDPSALRVNCFNEEVVDDRVQQMLAKLQIRTMRKCKMMDWQVCGNKVVSICFMEPLRCVTVPCFAFFYFGMKAIDINSFKAINECGLVYDGGLIVGPMFETNDPYIYGAGTCCMYSRRLYSSNMQHDEYFSEDVGEALAQIFIRKMNPFVMEHPDFSSCPSDLFQHAFNQTFLLWQPVLKFETPLSTYAVFPGPLYYMTVRRPGPDKPMEVQLTLPRQGHVLMTDKNSNYFRLVLNILHCVERVTCLAKDPFSPEIIAKLYGKHDLFFKKMLFRFQLNQIEDLYEFFVQPWMSALYQDTFRDLMNDINLQDIGGVYTLVRSLFNMDVTTSSNFGYRPSCQDFPCSDFHEKLGTFRSIIDKNIGQTSPSKIELAGRRPHDTPSECGQSPEIRAEAAKYWDEAGGENIVIGHIAKYLLKNSISNPHYAQPRPNDLGGT